MASVRSCRRGWEPARIEISRFREERVYSPLYGSWGWCARVLHPDLGWCNLGSVHDDLKIAFEHADLYIDEIMDETLIERIERVVKAVKRRKKS